MLRTPSLRRNKRSGRPARAKRPRPSHVPHRWRFEAMEERVLLSTTPGLDWVQQAELTISPDFEAGDHAGQNVAIDSDTIVFGAHQDDDAGADAGAAYVYVREDQGTPGDLGDDTWTKQAKLIGSDTAAGDEFGLNTAISGDTVVVGARQHAGTGAAYVFVRDNGGTPTDPSDDTWSQQAKLVGSDSSSGDLFGNRVALEGDTVVVTANRDDDGGVDSGSAYVFQRTGTAWSEQVKLTASDAAAGDRFGRAVDIDGEVILVGASQPLNGGPGAVYVFVPDDAGTPSDPSDDSWVQQDKLTASDGIGGEKFGDKVAMDGDTILASSPSDGDAGTNSGSAYVFVRDDGGTPTDPSDDTWVEQAKLTASDAAANDQFGRGVGIEGDTIAVGAWDGEIDVPDSGSVYVFERNDHGTPLDLTDDTWSEVGELTANDAGSGDNFGSSSVDFFGDTLVVADPQHSHNGANSGGVFVFVRDTTPPPPPPALLHFSLQSGGSVGGLSVANEDIVSFDGSDFSLLFDGSDVGVGGFAIDAFDVISDNEILMSFTGAGTVGGIFADDSDLVLFTATSLGEVTSGSFSLYFDGSDVGLTKGGEDVDAVSLLDDGRVLVSTTGSFSVPGASGRDEDLVAFTPSSLGSSTAGSWAMYFDGGDVGLGGRSEDVDAVGLDASGNLYLSTKGSFSVPGRAGADEDVFVFTPSSLGSSTSGSYDPALFFDGSLFGLGGNDLSAIDLPSGGTSASAGESNESVSGSGPLSLYADTFSRSAPDTDAKEPSYTPSPMPTSSGAASGSAGQSSHGASVVAANSDESVDAALSELTPGPIDAALLESLAVSLVG